MPAGVSKGASDAFSDHCSYLASRGMVAFSVEYGVVDKESGTAPLVRMHDAKSVMRWVRASSPKLGVGSRRIAADG